MRRSMGALGCALLLLLSSCSLIQGRQLLVITPHLEQRSGELVDGTFTPKNYAGLKDALLYFIREGVTQGKLQLSNYVGDQKEDVSKACSEVTRDDPIGAYAVDYMVQTSARASLWTIDIRYRRSKAEIQAILSINSTSALREQLRLTLARQKPSLVVEIGYYRADMYPVSDLIESVLLEQPALCLPPPAIEVQTYPNAGIQRLLDIQFTYAETAEYVAEYGAAAAQAAEIMVSDLPETAWDRAQALAIGLSQSTTVLANEIDPFSAVAYGALVRHSATARGIALAYTQLCETIGLPCLVVTGTRDGAAHWWNLVCVDELYYHVDISAWDGESELFQYDEQMNPACFWDTADLPAASQPPPTASPSP